MKLSSATLRDFTTLHGWLGLVAGFALFVAFYAGAFTVFRGELQQWQALAAGVPPPSASLPAMQQLLEDTLRTQPAAREHVGMLFATQASPRALIYWFDAGSWHYAAPDAPLQSGPPHAALAELVNALHFSLGIPGVGMTLMGIVSLLYGLALVTGFVIHLPQLVQDLFALRRGRNLKRFWQDAHNVIGVLSLPFHIVFAVTGTLLCIQMLIVAALDPLVFGGRLGSAMPAALDTAPTRVVSGTPMPTPSIERWLARARAAARDQGVADFEPTYLKLAHALDANAVVEITGDSAQALGQGALALDAHTGEVLSLQLEGARDANHATLSGAYALHFGAFGNMLVKWLYFVLGLGGAFLFYSGNLLWIESRRKRRQAAQTRGALAMARATVGACLGVCVAVGATFAATPLIERAAASGWWIATDASARAAGIDTALHVVCFGTWALCALWSCLRPPVLAARDLLRAAAWLASALPLIQAACLDAAQWARLIADAQALRVVIGVDALAIALALGFIVLARATARRAAAGEANSVWRVDAVAAA